MTNQQKEVSALLKKTRNGMKALKSNSSISENIGQKKLQSVIEGIEAIIQTDHYKILFVKSTLQNEFFWFITEASNFGSRDLAMKLCSLQEKLAQ